MLILSARPCAYNYKTKAIEITGPRADADTLAAINAEGCEVVCRGEAGCVIWHTPLNAMGDEGQHYLVEVKEG